MEKKKILIIDDDDDIVAGTKAVLESKGFDVYSASSKEEGRCKVEEIFPDLIIMDVMMKKITDGIDLSRELKASDKYKKIPILIVTALGQKTGFVFSADAGDENWLPVEDFAEKPIKPSDLIEKVEKLLE